MKLSRRATTFAALLAGVATLAAAAQATHWPFYGGDPGRSGFQTQQEPGRPVAAKWQKTGATDDNIRNSPVVGGGPTRTEQRVAYGTVDGTDARVHLQRLENGDFVCCEAGVTVSDDADAFTGASAYDNLSPAGVAFAEASNHGSTGQVYVVHNDDGQGGTTNDVAIAQIDEATGLIVTDVPVAGTRGMEISSSPVLTQPGAGGSRALFFVARRPTEICPSDPVPCEVSMEAPLPVETRLFRVPITNDAATPNAAIGAATSVPVPTGNPLASPALATLPSSSGPIGYVIVGADEPEIQTFRQDTLAAGPTVDLSPGDDAQTPSVPVGADGEPPATTNEMYVAVGQPADGTQNVNTKVFRVAFSAAASGTNVTTTAVSPAGGSPVLNGKPAPALALHRTAGSTGGEVVLTTGANLYVLDAQTLTPRTRLTGTFGGDLAAGTTGFSRTTAAVSGGLAFVSRDNGQPVVVDIATGAPVPGSDFTPHATHSTSTTAYGQPAISRRVVVFGSDKGAFAYEGAGPRFTVNDVEVVEGDGGTRIARFTIMRERATADEHTVTATTNPGPDPSATAGSDYIHRSDPVVFAPGQTTATFDVTINGDVAAEPDERFTVSLSTTAPGGDASDTGMGTIVDDDTPAPATTFAVGDASVTEGDSGTVNAVFTITKNGGGAADVTVNTADDTAAAPGDYAPITNQVVSFQAGETSKTVTVAVNGDDADEGDETYFVVLSNPTNGATLADERGLGLIRDDDDPAAGPGGLSISDVTIPEGDSGTVDATFTVVLDREATGPVTVDFATADATARAGSDYGARGGSLTFAPGEQTKNVVVPIIGDVTDEGSESFLVRLSNAGGAAIDDNEGTGTIFDDDRASLVVGDATTGEGDTGSRFMVFNVVLSNATGGQRTVDFATANGSATAGSDYSATRGSLTFAPGETAKTVLVPVTGDADIEPNETLELRLSNANGPVSRGVGTGVIVNDDRPRVRPALRARTTPGRDRTFPFRFTTRGRVIPPQGTDAEEACAVGLVAVQFKVVRKTISSRRVELRPNCTFVSRVTFDDRGRFTRETVRVQVRWLGNRVLTPVRARTHSVRVTLPRR